MTLHLYFSKCRVSVVVPPSGVSVMIKEIHGYRAPSPVPGLYRVYIPWAIFFSTPSPQINPRSSSKPKNYFNRWEKWHPERAGESQGKSEHSPSSIPASFLSLTTYEPVSPFLPCRTWLSPGGKWKPPGYEVSHHLFIGWKLL